MKSIRRTYQRSKTGAAQNADDFIGLARHTVPLYLDSDVVEFLTQGARPRGIEPRDLANEMLKKDSDLVRSGGVRLMIVGWAHDVKPIRVAALMTDGETVHNAFFDRRPKS